MKHTKSVYKQNESSKEEEEEKKNNKNLKPMANSFVMVEENARARTYIFPVNVFVYLFFFVVVSVCVCFIFMRIVRHQHHFLICTCGPLSQQFIHIVCGCVDVCVRACVCPRQSGSKAKQLCAFLRFFSLHCRCSLFPLLLLICFLLSFLFLPSFSVALLLVYPCNYYFVGVVC